MKKSLFVAAIAAISLVACKKGAEGTGSSDSLTEKADSATEKIDSTAKAAGDSITKVADSATKAIDSTAKAATPAAH